MGIIESGLEDAIGGADVAAGVVEGALDNTFKNIENDTVAVVCQSGIHQIRSEVNSRLIVDS